MIKWKSVQKQNFYIKLLLHISILLNPHQLSSIYEAKSANKGNNSTV